MTAYPAWTPATRPGIVPLHPYGFGTILGRSFMALRQNPRVLLGFALVVQAVAYLVLTAAVTGTAIASFSRLDTLRAGSDDYQAVLIGSVVVTIAVALLLGVAAQVLSTIVQGVVVADVAHAVVAEKPTLRLVWRRVRPSAWRLVAYSFLVLGATTVVIGILALVVVALGAVALPLGIAMGILLAIGAIPLYLWLATKLFFVPSVLLLERAGIGPAIARSWRLTRRRFWPTLGVIVVISLAFQVVTQVISIPLSLLAGGVSAVIAPTGSPEPGQIVQLIVVQVGAQAGVLLVQCIALVVQSTSAVLAYVDARMRHEGLDHDLQSYVEARDAGETDLVDPYRIGVGRILPPPVFWPAPAGWPAPGSPAAPGSTPVPDGAVPGAPLPAAPSAWPAAPASAMPSAPPLPAAPFLAPPPPPPAATGTTAGWPAPDAGSRDA